MSETKESKMIEVNTENLKPGDNYFIELAPGSILNRMQRVGHGNINFSWRALGVKVKRILRVNQLEKFSDGDFIPGLDADLKDFMFLLRHEPDNSDINPWVVEFERVVPLGNANLYDGNIVGGEKYCGICAGSFPKFSPWFVWLGGKYGGYKFYEVTDDGSDKAQKRLSDITAFGKKLPDRRQDPLHIIRNDKKPKEKAYEDGRRGHSYIVDKIRDYLGGHRKTNRIKTRKKKTRKNKKKHRRKKLHINTKREEREKKNITGETSRYALPTAPRPTHG